MTLKELIEVSNCGGYTIVVKGKKQSYELCAIEENSGDAEFLWLDDEMEERFEKVNLSDYIVKEFHCLEPNDALIIHVEERA